MIDLSKPLPSRPAHTTTLQTATAITSPVAVVGKIHIKKVTDNDTSTENTTSRINTQA